MALSAAERKRRSRAHQQGDHSLCTDPARCRDVTVTAPVTKAVTKPVTQAADKPDGVPSGLRRRGRRLWRESVDGKQLRPAELVLLEEACRTTDRLDRLDRLLSGEDPAWARFQVGDDGTEVTVVVDRLLSEARQQQIALKQLLSTLHQMQAPAAVTPKGQSAAPATAVEPPASEGADNLVDFAAYLRRA